MGDLIRTNSTQPQVAPQEEPVHTLPPASPADLFDIRRLWKVLMRKKLLIALVTIAVVVPVAAYSFLVTPTYRSTVSIQVDPESVKVLPYNGVADSLVKASPDFELYMKTQDVLLRSAALANRALDRVKQDYPAEDLPITGSSFADGLSIERVASSQIIDLDYVSFDPKFSALAANMLAEEFIKLHFERKVETTHKATDFLTQQLHKLKENVEQTESELIRYAQKNNILETNENQQNVIRERFGLLSTEVSRTKNAYLAIKAEYDELEGVTVDEFPASLRSPQITSLEGNVLTAEQELSRLRTQFGENWPDVVRKRSDLEVLKVQLQTEKEAALDRAQRDVRLRLKTAQSTYDAMLGQYKEQEALVHKLNEASIAYNSLKREVDASDQLYQGLLQRLKETGVSTGLEFGNIHITDAAKPNAIPYQPKPFWNISLGLILGLSAGAALAFFLDYMDNSLRSPADLERLGLPVLGWIPILPSPNGKKALLSKDKQMRSSTLQLATSQALVHPTDRIATMDIQSRESYRSLCASLLLSKAEQPARTILITSAVSREGKTTTASNVAVTLAETGAATLLIDADFRNPALSRRFGVKNERGLSVFLAGGGLEILNSHVAGLSILPSGPLPPNPVALFTAPRFTEAIVRLRERFRFIIIDSPPVLSLAESSVLAAKVDGVILVAKAASTPVEVVTRAKTQLARSGACILGAAFNQLDLRDPEYSYYSKYYTYGDSTAVGDSTATA